MKNPFMTPYQHHSGKMIVIDRGLGGEMFYAFMVKSEKSYQRFRGVPGGSSVAAVQQQLDQYRGKAIRKVI